MGRERLHRHQQHIPALPGAECDNAQAQADRYCPLQDADATLETLFNLRIDGNAFQEGDAFLDGRMLPSVQPAGQMAEDEVKLAEKASAAPIRMGAGHAVDLFDMAQCERRH